MESSVLVTVSRPPGGSPCEAVISRACGGNFHLRIDASAIQLLQDLSRGTQVVGCGRTVIVAERGAAGIIEEMAVNQTLLAEIVARILTVARPDRIILFGSAATGEMTKDSDIDLLIVEPTPGNRHEESVRVRDAIGNIDYPVDVLIMATERFEATRNVIGGIAYPANKYGRVLYAAA